MCEPDNKTQNYARSFTVDENAGQLPEIRGIPVWTKLVLFHS